MCIRLCGPSFIYLCESSLVNSPGKLDSVSELREPPVKTDSLVFKHTVQT